VEKTIQSVLPAGNVAHGQAWSHFCGFHEIVLPRKSIISKNSLRNN